MIAWGGSGPVAAARSPVVFSVIAWAIIAPFFVTAYGGFEQATSGQQWLQGLGVALVVHLGLLPIFLGAGAVERRLRAHPLWRAAWVILALLVTAVVRPAATSLLHLLVGIPPVATPWWLRLLVNAVAIGLALLVIHAVVRTVQRRIAVAARLDAVLADSTEGAAAVAAATDRLIAEFERAVADPVRRALDAAIVEPFDAARQGAALRQFAHEVVRPLSHHVFAAELEEPPPAPADGRATRFRIAARALPAQPWAPALVFSVIMYPTMLIGYGPGEALVRIGVGAVWAVLGCWLLGRVRARSRRRQIVALLLGYLAVGFGLTAVYLDAAVLPLPSPGAPVSDFAMLTYWCYLPLAFALVAMLLVIVRSELTEARALETELAGLLLASQRRAAAARLEHAGMRARLARVLHNQVQGEVIALALRLKLGSAGEEEVRRLPETIDAMLADAVLPGSDADGSVSPATMARNAQLAISSWAHAIEVRSTATPEVWDWLAPRPAAAGVLLDAAFEGLTNAVRHEEAVSASLDFARTADGVRLTLRTPGRLPSGVTDGFGLGDLRRRGALVGLEHDGRDVVLRVEVGGE